MEEYLNRAFLMMTLVREGQFSGNSGWRCHTREEMMNERTLAVKLLDARPLLSGGAIYIRWDSDEPGPAVQPRSELDHHRFRRTLDNATLEDFKNQQCSTKEKRVPENGCKKTIFTTVYVRSEHGYWVLNLSKDRYAEYLNAIENDDTGSVDDIMKTFGAKWIKDTSEDPELKAIQDKAKAHGVNNKIQ